MHALFEHLRSRDLEWIALALFAFSALSTVLSLGLGAYVLVHLPADYFAQGERPARFDRPADPPAILRALGRNALGWGLVLVGIVLSIPGVPGQGLLTVLAGLVLADFPGKFRLERALIARPALRHAANRLRARFGQPPFVV